jgi:hypothetical protein
MGAQSGRLTDLRLLPATDSSEGIETTMTGTTTRGRRLAGALLAVSLAAGAIVTGATDAGAASKIGSEEFGLTFKQLVRKVEAVEQRIAKCMDAAGFEYVANDFDSVRKAMNADKSAPGLSESEFRHQYGYGISTQFDKPIVNLGLGEENASIREALSPADQVAYDRTLLGRDTEAVFANALEAEDFSRTGGCTRKAVQKEFTKKQLSESYINPGDQKVQQDPRMKAALKKYATCMNDGGVDQYATPDEVEPDIQSQFDAIAGGQDPESLDATATAKLKDLQAFEIRVADLSFKCEEKFVAPVQERVEKEIYGRLPR